MPDKSLYPCKKCGHKQNDHGRHFDYCYACKDNRKSSHCKFERIENLAFLEWLTIQKES
jgi:hypothetical protein